MRTKGLEIAAAKIALGLIASEDLPRAAVSALEDGCDSPSLRVLAGLTMVEIDEARPLFDRVLAEMNVPKMDERKAVDRLAHESAKEILNGSTSPYQGAKRIWKLSLYLPDECRSAFNSFVYAASEWEDRPEDRSVFEAGIKDAASELLSRWESA